MGACYNSHNTMILAIPLSTKSYLCLELSIEQFMHLGNRYKDSWAFNFGTKYDQLWAVQKYIMIFFSINLCNLLFKLYNTIDHFYRSWVLLHFTKYYMGTFLAFIYMYNGSHHFLDLALLPCLNNWVHMYRRPKKYSL